MASTKQLVANRSNSRRSTGPRTAKGKAISARNSTRHGLLAELRVLPEVERQAEWDDHLTRTIESVNPVGYVETLLTERLAFTLWRLRRLANFEQGAGAINIRKAVFEPLIERGPDHMSLFRAESRAQADLHLARHDLEILGVVRRMKPENYVDPDVAARIVALVADVGDLEVDYSEVRERFGDGAAPEMPLEELPWTVGVLVETLADLKGATDIEAEDALQASVEGAAAALEDVTTQILARRRERAIPAADVVERIQRYEAALERSVFRTLHEIERLQAHRTGGNATAPVVVDVTVDSAACGAE